MRWSRPLRSVTAATVAFLFGSFFVHQLHAADAAFVTAPQQLLIGGEGSITVSTFDDTDQRAVDRSLEVSLVAGDGAEVVVHSGRTGLRGQAFVRFSVPASLAVGSYTLRARVGGIEEDLEVDLLLVKSPGILIETDKPIYKPGQRIQGRVVLLGNDLRPVAGEIQVTIHDAKGIRIDRRQLTTDVYGAAAFDLDLATELNFGVWKVRAQSEGADASRDVRVEEYTLPRYELGANFARTWALVDEAVPGTVEARYFFGKDVEGVVSVVANRYVGTWEEYARFDGELSGGSFDFELPAVGFVSGTPGANGLGSVTVDIEVTDSTGHTQSTTEVLSIASSGVVISIIPRSRSLKPGIAAEVVVTTEAPDGTPVSIDVETQTTFIEVTGSHLETRNQTVTTENGFGVLTLEPPANTAYAEIHANATLDGRRSQTSAQVGSAYSPSGNFISLARTGGTGPVSIGEAVSFSVLATHPGTVYYEVYAGGRTILSDASEENTFAITVTPEMLPAANVIAYVIQPDNEVSADSTRLDVELSLSLSVAADFNAETVKPGDEIEVTLDAGTGARTLLGVSIVDNSVLALGRSRLHMADVFAELEARFLEPQVEVHEPPGFPGGDIGGPELGFGDVFGGPLQTFGAMDVLKEAGLTAVASANVQLPAGSPIDFWLAFDDAEGPAPPPAAGPGEGSGTEPPIRVRQFFPETWVWEPTLLTDEDGRAQLTLTAPDSITSWKLAVVGTCPAPQNGSQGVGFGEAELTVFQDFFVEPSLPFSVVRGEEIPVKVDVFNYLDTAQTVQLDFAASEGFELTGESQLTVDIDAGAATSVEFPIRPAAIGDFPISITARGDTLSDAVLRPLKIVAEGRPEEIVLNGLIEAGQTLPLDVAFPEDIVSDSERAYLHLTPSPVAQTMQGVADLLNMPYGCGEQNMIFLAPDIEILKYLREVGELAPEIRATAEYYVNVGYQRQLTYQTDDGGFAAFGGAEGSLWLTAFVLSTFSGAREVRDIDETVLMRAADMLVGRQNADGSFRTDDFLIHTEMDGGLENLFAMTAYTAQALAEYGGAGVETPLQSAAGYLRDNRTLPEVNEDPYSLSIAAVTLLKVPGFESVAESIIDRLLELAITEGVGMHWEPYPVETTGYAAMALLNANGGVGRPQAGAAIDWLSTARNSLGGYGESTQDTVVAIRALFLAARKVRRDLTVDISVRDGGEELFSVHVDENNFDLFHQMGLPLVSGLTLHSEGSGNVGFQVVKRFNVPGELLPPPRDMEFEVTYDTTHVEVDQVVDVRVRMRYTGDKEKTGMVLADVGVPTGFDAVRSSLNELVEADVVERVEQAGRKVIFYVNELVRDEALQFEFQIVARFPVEAEGPISRVYEYYDTDVEAYDREGVVTIVPPSEVEFIRGDANDDTLVDLSDAVTTLNHLFLNGGEGTFCADAGDANDDGTLNITDPIQILNYLFLGGTVPRPPFPEPGIDPTADALRCDR